jgi:hypothetical protein
MVGGDKRRDKYLVVWPIFWNVGIIDRRAYPRHTAARGKCVELARCDGSDLGVSKLRCVVMPHLVHPRAHPLYRWLLAHALAIPPPC